MDSVTFEHIDAAIRRSPLCEPKSNELAWASDSLRDLLAQDWIPGRISEKAARKLPDLKPENVSPAGPGEVRIHADFVKFITNADGAAASADTAVRYFKALCAILSLRPDAKGLTYEFKEAIPDGSVVLRAAKVSIEQRRQAAGAAWAAVIEDESTLAERLFGINVSELRDSLFPTIMMSLAHLDASLYSHRRMPRVGEHAVAIQKMRADAGRTFALLLSADDSAGDEETLRARIESIRSSQPLTHPWTVHGYASLWRRPRGHGRRLLQHVQRRGNPRESLESRAWGDQTPSPQTPVAIDGVFTAVQLARYLRIRGAEPVRTSGRDEVGRTRHRHHIVNGRARNLLLSEIIEMVRRDAFDGIFYDHLLFRLTHDEDAQFFRSFEASGGWCVWEPRSSLYEIIVTLDLVGGRWDEAPGHPTRHLNFADAGRGRLGTPDASVRQSFAELIDLYQRADREHSGLFTRGPLR